VDLWVAKFDPAAVRVPPKIEDGSYVEIVPTDVGTAGIFGNIHAPDGAALDQRLDALAATVCDNDPRTSEQRRADATGPVTSDTPGYLPGFGILPADSVREVAKSATLKPLEVPVEVAPDPGYRPRAKTLEFIRWRDLTCRWPGCDRPVDKSDIDHTVPWPYGPTHPSNNKPYCRTHRVHKRLRQAKRISPKPTATETRRRRDATRQARP
jgi:hypothetical protein